MGPFVVRDRTQPSVWDAKAIRDPPALSPPCQPSGSRILQIAMIQHINTRHGVGYFPMTQTHGGMLLIQQRAHVRGCQGPMNAVRPPSCGNSFGKHAAFVWRRYSIPPGAGSLSRLRKFDIRIFIAPAPMPMDWATSDNRIPSWLSPWRER